MVDDVLRHTERNRIAWDAVAERRRANCPPPAFFAAGGSTLGPEETAAFGDVSGLRVLNLQCSSGNDALSLAAMGAEVVGVDISTGAIRIAREQAAAAGLTADFLAHDVYQLPDRLQDSSFDVVYSTAGIICWLPDLDRWARIVAAALRPGGRLLLDEHHPVWETATVRPEGGVDLTQDYFSRHRPVAASTGDPGKAAHAGGEPLVMDTVTFLWPLGDVVTALAGAGLRLVSLQERPVPQMYLAELDAPTDGQRRSAGLLPAAYLLVMTKG